jgi:hypothetical protein
MKKDLPAPKKHPVGNVPVNYVMRFSGPVLPFFPPSNSTLASCFKMGKRKNRPEDGEIFFPDALVGTLKSLLQDVPSEQRNDAATVLQHLEAGPKQRVSTNLEGRRMLNYHLDSSSY